MVFSIRLTEIPVAATEITLFAKKEKDAARKVPEKAELPLVLTLTFSYLCLDAWPNRSRQSRPQRPLSRPDWLT